MVATLNTLTIDAQNAHEIPGPDHAEAGRLAQTEYERVLAVLESLEGDDWSQQTYCTEWDVRDMAAHLAGSVTASTSLAQFRHVYMTNPYLKQMDEPADAANRLQVEERSEMTAAQVVDEFRRSGPIAIRKRDALPWIVRAIPLPMGPDIGLKSVGYLMDVIYPRDEWMHRYDICAATGKQMVVTPQHDGRLIALVVWELARKIRRELGERTILLRLTGEAGGDYLFGAQSEPDCILEMSVFTFALRSSERITVAETEARVDVQGDNRLADWFMHNMEVPY